MESEQFESKDKFYEDTKGLSLHRSEQQRDSEEDPLSLDVLSLVFLIGSTISTFVTDGL